MKKIDVMGVAFDDMTMEEAVERALTLARDGAGAYVATPNPEIVMLAQKDPGYAETLAGTALTLPDGIGVIYAAKILKRPLKGRIPGIDFAAALLARMAEEGLKLYLLGAKPGVAEQAAENLKEKYPGLIICGVHDGYFQEDGPVIRDIRGKEADVVFVCLGAPKQEEWMRRNGKATGAGLLVGLGGSLDVFAGAVQRAPEWMQKTGLEWLYRLVKQPSRIGRMAKLPGFLVKAVFWKDKGGDAA